VVSGRISTHFVLSKSESRNFYKYKNAVLSTDLRLLLKEKIYLKKSVTNPFG